MEVARILAASSLTAGTSAGRPIQSLYATKKRQASGHAHAFLLPDRRGRLRHERVPEVLGKLVGTLRLRFELSTPLGLF